MNKQSTQASKTESVLLVIDFKSLNSFLEKTFSLTWRFDDGGGKGFLIGVHMIWWLWRPQLVIHIIFIYIKPFSDSCVIFPLIFHPLVWEPPSPSAVLNGRSCAAGIWPGDNLNLMVSWAQFSQVLRNPIQFFRLGGGLVAHSLCCKHGTFAVHSQEEKQSHNNKMSAAPLCVSFNTNFPTESNNLTCFQCPDSLCCSSLLTDWLIHFTMSITWIVHSQLDPVEWPERSDNWQNLGFTNIKKGVMRGSLNPQTEQQGYTNMDSDLTTNQYRESCRQSRVAALFFPVMFALSGHLLLTNRDMLLSCLLSFNHYINVTVTKT